MQHHRAQATRMIAVPADELWKTIHQATHMEQWYPQLITQSSISDDQGTMRRVCTLANGGQLHERILLRDDATRTFVYAIDKHPLPPVNVVGTIRIDAVDGGSHVTWDSQFTVADEAADETVAMVVGMYEDGLESLALYHGEKAGAAA